MCDGEKNSRREKKKIERGQRIGYFVTRRKIIHRGRVSNCRGGGEKTKKRSARSFVNKKKMVKCEQGKNN